MRTTLDIEDGLLVQAKIRAAQEHRTLRSLVEYGLRQALAIDQPRAMHKKIRWVVATGGAPEAVHDRAAMYEWTREQT